MMNYSSVLGRIVKLFVVWCFTAYSTNVRALQYSDDEGYYMGNNYYDAQPLRMKINLALQKLEHTPKWVKEWPDPNVRLGQVSGLALDLAGRLLVFHRDTNVWNDQTFSVRNVYQNIGEPPIQRPTILAFNDTGHLVDSWGQNLFYMPHGITVDAAGNVWLTDVALHQVFKFTPDQREKPALVLGEKFVPGNDDQHFCKPTSVAVLSTGDFFVADGYCNHRILKYSPAGEIILQWGKAQGHANDPFVFNVPHALTLAEDHGAVCTADRERGRVACFRCDNGTFVSGYSSWLIGSRLFSVAYTPAHGGLLYVVNGPYSSPRVPVRGYVIQFSSGTLVGTFAPPGDLHNPHDVVVAPSGGAVYVAELDPYKVHKFIREPAQILQPTPTEVKANITHGKSTAIVGECAKP